MADLLVGRSRTGTAVLAHLAEIVGVNLPGALAAAEAPYGMTEGG